LYGLMICGVPDYSRTAWLAGANVNDEISVRRSQSLDIFYRTPGQPRPVLDDASLGEAASLRGNVLTLFQSAEHRRVRVGFGKLIDGLKNSNPQVRLHEFVRSIDGLMGLEI